MDVIAGERDALLRTSNTLRLTADFCPRGSGARPNQFRQMIFVGKVSEVAPMAPEEPNSAYRASQVRDS
jgi:hypothetical protein